MDQSFVTAILGEDFIFDCRRAIYWPRHKILIAADLHWGKTQYLRNHGMAISDRVFSADLQRLGSLYEDYDVRSFLVLGDLIHHEEALTHEVVERVARFRHDFPSELILVKGNHDRYTRFPDTWGIVEEKDFLFEDFYFCHDYNKKVKNFQFSGHIHPVFRFKAGPDLLSLPSFIVDQKFCLLPAFSYLTHGQAVSLKQGQKAVVVSEHGLDVFER